MRDALLQAVEELQGEITAISRDLHDHPETGLEEHRSAEMLRGKLRSAGFDLAPGAPSLPTSFVARLAGGAPSPRVAFLAEYDALPGIGHGCGHNMVAAAAVGAALALARAAAARGAPLPGEVLVVGTPAEETIGGKIVMVREGLFRGVDAAMMVHPATEWRVFTDSLACASIEVTYIGREAHAVVEPEKGIDALDPLIRLFVSLDALRERFGREVRIPGVILEGGLLPNVVPARAVGAFTLRAPTVGRLMEVRAGVEGTARALGEAAGCEVRIRQTDNTYDDMVTNAALARRFKEHLGSMGVETVDGPRGSKGSLDMGSVSRACPSIHAFIEVAEAGTPLHSAAFAEATTRPRAAAALLTAVKALALTAFDAMSDRRLLEEARLEFECLSGREPPP